MHRSLCLVACFNVLLVNAVAPAPESPSSFATFMDRNDSTLLTSIISSFNGSANTDPQEPRCLQQGRISHQMQPISIGHCYQLLIHLIARFSASPVPWNTPDHLTPKLWTWGSCMISFEKRRPESWDVFSELQVAKAAASTIVKCVKADTGWLGGQFTVGPRMEFWVTVFGRGWPLRVMEAA